MPNLPATASTAITYWFLYKRAHTYTRPSDSTTRYCCCSCPHQRRSSWRTRGAGITAGDSGDTSNSQPQHRNPASYCFLLGLTFVCYLVAFVACFELRFINPASLESKPHYRQTRFVNSGRPQYQHFRLLWHPYTSRRDPPLAHRGRDRILVEALNNVPYSTHCWAYRIE